MMNHTRGVCMKKGQVPRVYRVRRTMADHRYIGTQNQIIAGMMADIDNLRKMISDLQQEQMKIKHRVFPTPPMTPRPLDTPPHRRPVSVPYTSMGVLSIPEDYRPVTVPTKLPQVHIRTPRPPIAPRKSRYRPGKRPGSGPPTPYAFGKGMMMV